METLILIKNLSLRNSGWAKPTQGTWGKKKLFCQLLLLISERLQIIKSLIIKTQHLFRPTDLIYLRGQIKPSLQFSQYQRVHRLDFIEIGYAKRQFLETANDAWRRNS